MTTAESTGRTVDEAVEKALAQLGVTRSEVDVEVLQEPKAALLGFGGREARVRIAVRPGAAEALGALMAEIVRLMGLQATVSIEETPDGLLATLDGRALAGLVGRDGRALDALETVAGLRMQRLLGRRVHLVVDAMGYRSRREREVREAARHAAERAHSEGTQVALAPMSARDRRSAHLALKEDTRVATSSQGEDDARHVVVLPRATDDSGNTAEAGSKTAREE